MEFDDRDATRLPTFTLGVLVHPCSVLTLPVRLALAVQLTAPGDPVALWDTELAALHLPEDPAEQAGVLAELQRGLPNNILTVPALRIATFGQALPLLTALDRRIDTATLVPKLAQELARRRVTTWRALAACRPADLAKQTRLGSQPVGVLFKAAFVAVAATVLGAEQMTLFSEAGATSEPLSERNDLITLLDYERRSTVAALQNALCGFVVEDAPNDVQEAARRLLALCPVSTPDADRALPEAGQLDMISRALDRFGDVRDRIVFERLCLTTETRAAQLAAALEVGCESIRRFRLRAESHLRELAGPGSELGELVTKIQGELGCVAERGAVDRVLAEHGLAPASDVRSQVCLWLAGPYRDVSDVRGAWLAVDGEDVWAATRRLLAQDGGVHSTELIRKELTRLGVHDQQVDGWLGAQPVRVFGDVTVLTNGAPAAVAERVLSGTGQAMTPAELVSWVGGSPDREDHWWNALRRDHRFVLNSAGCFELAEWGGVMLDACPTRETDERCGGRGEDATLQIVVDDQLLAGASGPVPAGLLDRLGIASGATRSISTRYGPLALSNAAQGPRRSSLRPVALAGGATCGDVLVLRFAPDRATATVEITSRVMDRISQ